MNLLNTYLRHSYQDYASPKTNSGIVLFLWTLILKQPQYLGMELILLVTALIVVSFSF